MTLFRHLPGCRILQVSRDGASALRLGAEAKRDHACCPTCRTASRSVHSRYHQQPADLPTSGQLVRLTLTIRRLYCHKSARARRTFAERLLRLLDRYAQRTHRLADAQVRPALALGAAPAARLLPHLAMPTRSTIPDASSKRLAEPTHRKQADALTAPNRAKLDAEKLTPEEQRLRFIEAAREAAASEDEVDFDAALKQITKPKKPE